MLAGYKERKPGNNSAREYFLVLHRHSMRLSEI